MNCSRETVKLEPACVVICCKMKFVIPNPEQQISGFQVSGVRCQVSAVNGKPLWRIEHLEFLNP